MKNYLSLAAVAAVFVCAAAVNADTVDNGPVGVSLKIGGFYPTQEGTRNTAGDSWLTAGIDYKLNTLKMSNMAPDSYFSISMDYAGKNNDRIVPLLLNYTSGQSFYWSVGLGFSFTNFVQDDGVQNDKTRFAYSAAIGYNFGGTGQIPVFLELRYQGNEQPRVAGIAATIGARF